MNQVSVVFEGMILWWMAVNPGYALVPDLSKWTVPHTATLRASRTAFKGEKCPPGFSGTDVCSLDLKNAGATGGVQIEITTSTPSNDPTEMCEVPKLKPPDPKDQLVLRPQFTPGTGSRNAAWMAVQGGKGSTYAPKCKSKDDDCPRSAQWTVPVAKGSSAVLVLKNLKDRADIAAVLSDGARLLLSNVQSSALDALALNEQQDDDRNRGELSSMYAEDWCAYFEMVALKGRPNDKVSCSQPQIPTCDAAADGTADAAASADVAHLHGMRRQETIACSSSQYP